MCGRPGEQWVAPGSHHLVTLSCPVPAGRVWRARTQGTGESCRCDAAFPFFCRPNTPQCWAGRPSQALRHLLSPSPLPFISPPTPSLPLGCVRPLTLLCTQPSLIARSPRRTGLPGPQRGCGRPGGARLPRAPRPSRTGWRPRCARTARETGRGGESAPRGQALLDRKSLWGAAYARRLGGSRGSWVPEAGPTLLIREDGCGCGCGRKDFSRCWKHPCIGEKLGAGGVTGHRSSSPGSQGLLPERLSLLSGPRCQ